MKSRKNYVAVWLVMGIFLLFGITLTDVSASDAAPIPISTAEQFLSIGNDPDYPEDGNYFLTGDIDLGNSTSDRAIGGIFDGNGHTITMNASGRYARALFRIVREGGEVKNLTMAGRNAFGVAFSGTDPNPYSSNVGGIAATNNGTIQNCFVKGEVKGAATGGAYPENKALHITVDRKSVV